MRENNFFFDNSLNFEDFNNYMSKWMDGIYSEIYYWDDFVNEKIDKKDILLKKGFNKKKAILNYQDSSYLEEEYSCVFENAVVLDIGCGAVPMYAELLKSKKISFHSVDLLASVYQKIYSNLDIEICDLPHLGLVEDLTSSFSQNSFDFVHMSNSLDHCFDPILGLWQMLYVCKIGGKIILRHNGNEALRENSSGLHQWNINIEDGRFVFWRDNKKYDIAKLLEGYAVIDNTFLTKLKSNSKIDVNFAVIRKIASSPLYSNPYINQLTVRLLSEYSLKVYDNMFNEKEILYSLLKSGFSVGAPSYSNVHIYGAGVYGKCVYRVLNKIGIKVKFVFDKNAKFFCNSITVEPYSIDKVDTNDCILIASQAYKDEIESLILKDSVKKNFKYIKFSE